MRKIEIDILFVAILMIFMISCKSVRKAEVTFNEDPVRNKIDVFLGDRYFTSLIYSDTIEKPVLFPIVTTSGKTVTRGYPIDPRPYERIDHPHHMGLWFNFGDVNGLDFWNNSSAIAPERKKNYGHICLDSIIRIDSKRGELVTLSSWRDHQEKKLLSEKTTYRFSEEGDQLRFIERNTQLTALQQVVFKSNKEGMFAIRVDRAFEEPGEKPVKRVAASGHRASDPSIHNEGVNGRYRNQQGNENETEVWGKKTAWVALRAAKEGEIITLVILDHPLNQGYPGWPHARGYGLFSMNNLGGSSMDPDDSAIEIVLNPGEKINFRHKLIIGGDMTDEMINNQMQQFHQSQMYN